MNKQQRALDNYFDNFLSSEFYSTLTDKKKLGGQMRKILSFFLFTLILIPIIILSFIPLINNYIVYEETKKITQISPLKDTKYIESKRLVGKLNGNGNNVEYLAVVLIKSNAELNELKKYYHQYEVQKQESLHFDNELLIHQSIKFDQLGTNKKLHNYFVIYRYWYPSYGLLNFDLRGH